MLTKGITEEQQKRLLMYLKPPYDLIYKIGINTGLRVSDIVSMHKRILSIKEPTIKERKTGKSKRIYIPAKLRNDLICYCANNDSDYIFKGTGSKGHITRQSVHKVFKRAATKAGITDNISTHTMRKNYARKLMKKGKSLKYIQSKLNHKSLMDTLLYLTDER